MPQMLSSLGVQVLLHTTVILLIYALIPQFFNFLAGGMSALLHADFLRTLIVDTANYRAIPDAG